MSVDWFIQCFDAAKPQSFDIDVLNSAFIGVDKKESFVEDTRWWDLACGPSMTLGKRGKNRTDSILINRPIAEPRLLEAIYSLLKREGFILFSPALDRPFVGNPRTGSQLPLDLIEALGKPITLNSTKEFEKFI